jgi:hypothetical protein
MAKKKEEAKKALPKKVKKTKMDMIKEHLIKYKTITSWEAITLYKETRLASKIEILRNKRGWKIETIKFVSEEGTPYAKYFLRSLPKK